MKRFFVSFFPLRHIKTILVAGLFTIHYSLFAQYGTCDKAAEINTSTFGSVTPSPATDQLCSERNSEGKYFDAEHNVAWFTFVVPEDTTLTFDIIPKNTGDDLDFLLFKEEQGGEFCSHLGIINNNDPVRTNLSKVGVSKNGRVGLSRKAEEKIVPKNGTSAYSKAIRVKKGERYYLVVDNRNEAGEFSIYMDLDFTPGIKKATPVATKPTPSYMDANIVRVPHIQEPKKDSIIPAPPVDKPTPVVNIPTVTVPVVVAPPPPPPAVKPTKTVLTVKIVDTLGNPVKAELDIEGVIQGQTMTMITSQDSCILDPLQSVSINCNAVGYVFTQASYIAPDTPTRYDIILSLTQIRQGQSIILKGIQFEEGNAKLLEASNVPLMNVVSFLRNNTSVKIMIKGFVNDPFGNNSGAAKKLSKERAEAVRDYLHTNGVSTNRMEYKGFGNEHMLFPNPTNKVQEQANRRVEIEIK